MNIERGSRLLGGLVEYQSGAVVSRTIVRKSADAVTIFAADAGQRMTEAAAPHETLILGVEGEVEISIEGAHHKLISGEVLLMPAGKPHAVRAVTPSKILLVTVRNAEAPPRTSW